MKNESMMMGVMGVAIGSAPTQIGPRLGTAFEIRGKNWRAQKLLLG